MSLQQHMPKYIFRDLLFLLFILGKGHVFAHTAIDKCESCILRESNSLQEKPQGAHFFPYKQTTDSFSADQRDFKL